MLDLTYHMYDVTVDISPCDSDKESLSLSIVVSEGTTERYNRTADTSQTFHVDLPDPPGSKLWFLADFDTWKDSFAIKVCIPLHKEVIPSDTYLTSYQGSHTPTFYPSAV